MFLWYFFAIFWVFKTLKQNSKGPRYQWLYLYTCNLLIINNFVIDFIGLGFTAHNADDWFKAGEDYSRLLSQLTEKFDQYQTLSKESDEKTTKKKSLVQNSLDSRSRVQ